jgi:hypothetical protein
MFRPSPSAWFSTIGPFSDSKPKPDVHAIVQSRIARTSSLLSKTRTWNALLKSRTEQPIAALQNRM